MKIISKELVMRFAPSEISQCKIIEFRNNTAIRSLSYTLIGCIFLCNVSSSIAEVPVTLGSKTNIQVSFAEKAEIPRIYRDLLTANQSQKTYVEKIPQTIQVFTGKMDNFTKEDRETVIQKLADKKRREQRDSFIKDDMNFDGSVTLDEMRQRFNEDRAPLDYDKSFPYAQNGFNKIDLNGDGRLDVSEMTYLKPDYFKKKRKGYIGNFDGFMACDFNKDGTLTVAELRAGAIEAFSFFDLNKDGMINREEFHEGKRF